MSTSRKQKYYEKAFGVTDKVQTPIEETIPISPPMTCPSPSSTSMIASPSNMSNCSSSMLYIAMGLLVIVAIATIKTKKKTKE